MIAGDFIVIAEAFRAASGQPGGEIRQKFRELFPEHRFSVCFVVLFGQFQPFHIYPHFFIILIQSQLTSSSDPNQRQMYCSQICSFRRFPSQNIDFTSICYIQSQPAHSDPGQPENIHSIQTSVHTSRTRTHNNPYQGVHRLSEDHRLCRDTHRL